MSHPQPPSWQGEASAKALAYFAHLGQTDKAGKPYIEHPERVVNHLLYSPRWFDLDPEARQHALQAAWLHDVLEDTSITVPMLVRLHVPRRVRQAVIRLTRMPHIEPEAYYAHVRADPIALAVKASDIADNSDPSRLALLDPKVRARLSQKYAKARAHLGLA